MNHIGRVATIFVILQKMSDIQVLDHNAYKRYIKGTVRSFLIPTTNYGNSGVETVCDEYHM